MGDSVGASGAEDAVLKIWDTRASPEDGGQSYSKIHQAGIVSLMDVGNYGLITGSYDNHIR